MLKQFGLKQKKPTTTERHENPHDHTRQCNDHNLHNVLFLHIVQYYKCLWYRETQHVATTTADIFLPHIRKHSPGGRAPSGTMPGSVQAVRKRKTREAEANTNVKSKLDALRSAALDKIGWRMNGTLSCHLLMFQKQYCRTQNQQHCHHYSNPMGPYNDLMHGRFI